MSSKKSPQSRFFWGSMLILFGILLLLDRLYIINFGYVISNFWPLILVIIGAKMILFPSSKAKKEETTVKRKTEVKWEVPSNPTVMVDYISENRFIGDLDLVIESDNFKGGTTSTFIGDLKIDLTKARIPSGDRTLVISGFIGDAKIKLPTDTAYLIQANAAIGDFKVLGRFDDGFGLNKIYKSPDYDLASARLSIRISFFIGDVSVH